MRSFLCALAGGKSFTSQPLKRMHLCYAPLTVRLKDVCVLSQNWYESESYLEIAPLPLSLAKSCSIDHHSEMKMLLLGSNHILAGLISCRMGLTLKGLVRYRKESRNTRGGGEVTAVCSPRLKPHRKLLQTFVLSAENNFLRFDPK